MLRHLLGSVALLIAACDSTPAEPTSVPTGSDLDAAKDGEPVMSTGDGVPQEVVVGDPKGCFARAQKLIRSNPSALAAVPELTCACDGGVAMACTHLGAWYRDGTVVPRDEKKSTAYYERACELGDGWGCSDWGSALSKGRGVPVDFAAAHEAALRACELDSAKGCSNAGMHLMNGRAGNQDFAAAAKLLARGCRLNDAFSCKMEKVARDPDTFRGQFRDSCNAGSQDSCVNLALLLPVEAPERKQLLRKACDAGHAQACTTLEL